MPLTDDQIREALAVCEAAKAAAGKGRRAQKIWNSRCAHERACFEEALRELLEAREEIERLRAEVHEWEESDAAGTVLQPVLAEELEKARARIAELEVALRVAHQASDREATADLVRSLRLENLP